MKKALDALEKSTSPCARSSLGSEGATEMKTFLRGLAAPIMALLAFSFAVPAYAQVVHIAGSDGSTNREVPVTTAGALVTSTTGGADAPNSTATTNPVRVAGCSAALTNTCTLRNFVITSTGETFITGALTTGTSGIAANGLLVGGSDGTNYRHFSVNTGGQLQIAGVTSSGSAIGSNMIAVGGTDGTNARTLNVTTGGILRIVGSVNSGASDDGLAPVKIGGVYNSTLPTFTTGQRGDLQIAPDGSARSFLVGPTTTVKTSLGVSSGLMTGQGTYATQVPLATSGFLYNGSTQDQAVSLAGSSSTGVGVAAVGNVPGSSTALSILPSNGSAVASSLVVKASAGNLYRVSLVAGASAGFLMVFDATSAPADGAVTPKICRPVAANGALDIDLGTAPYRFATGITMVFSTTGCFSKTASATAYMEAAAP